MPYNEKNSEPGNMSEMFKAVILGANGQRRPDVLDSPAAGVAPRDKTATTDKERDELAKAVMAASKRTENVSNKIGGLSEQITCMLKQRTNPLAMVATGTLDFPKWASFSRRAYEFANAGNVLDGAGDDEGSERGAFRHALWQSEITSAYGTDNARKIGDCHEREVPFDPNRRIFRNSADADRAVDQLNNIIGRRLGTWYDKGLSPNEKARLVLNYAAKAGLFVSTKTPDGSYIVEQRPISREKYLRLMKEFGERGWYGTPR